MKEIFYITTNKAKVEWANKKLSPFNIKAVQKPFFIPEPQEHEVQDVALFKAKYVMKYMKKPFIIDDTGFHVRSLNNFPGTYLKFVLGTIGAQGICQLAEHKGEKSTNLRSVLVYVDENQKTEIFTCDDRGMISDQPRGDKRCDWGDIMRIHIPNGFEKTLAEMDDEEFKRYEEGINSDEHYTQLGLRLSK